MIFFLVKNLSFLIVLSASCAFSVHCFDWTQVPGGLTHVSTSINYHWGVNSADQIFRCARPCTGSWVKVDGALIQTDVSDMEVWGVNKGNNIYKRSTDGTGSWINIPGKLKHVSASGNGYIWGVNSADNIYVCKKSCNGQWKGIAGKLKQIDGGERYVYGVNSGNIVYYRPIDGSGSWAAVTGKKMKYVSVGADAVYGVDEGSKVFECALPCTSGGAWKEVEFCLPMKQVEATVEELIGTSTSGAVYKRAI